MELNVICPDDGETQVTQNISLDEIKVQISDDHSKDIKLDDKLTLRMKYPSMNEFIQNNFNSGAASVTDTFDLIISCIEQIYNEEESWSASDSTKKELLEFVEGFSSKQFKEVEKFFETMPKLKHTIKVTNPKTKVESDIVLEGLSAFFM